jgi:sigma-B regulation protein RsbU (phosphoserine phosphatase)
MRRNGTDERLAQGGVPLGLFESSSYELGEMPFSDGDRLILFTDGVVETTSSDGTEFGDGRLVDVARACRTRTAPSMAAQIIETVRLVNNDAFGDDATLIVCALDGVAG